MAASTFSRISGETCPFAPVLHTRETAIRLTPARAATSLIVGAFFCMTAMNPAVIMARFVVRGNGEDSVCGPSPPTPLPQRGEGSKNGLPMTFIRQCEYCRYGLSADRVSDTTNDRTQR